MIRLHLGENSLMALDTLRNHKVRSFLTVLGVVIGVTAVIAVGSILVGLDRDIQESLEQFGSNTLFIFKFQPGIHFGRLSTEERSRKPLTLEDGLAIKELCPSVKNVSVIVFPRVGQGPRPIPEARYQGRESDVNYNGTLPSYEQVEEARIAKGRFFSDAEDLHRAEVVVIGYDLDRSLFPGEDALGKTLLIAGHSYQVVGVLEKRKGNVLRGEGSDVQALVPYRTYRKHNPNDDEHFIAALAYPGRKDVAEDEIRGLLRQRRRVPMDQPDTFGISSAQRIADQLRDITANVALLTIAISSIGLLVGGVGVMNIIAHVGHRAYPRDRRAQGPGRPPPRHHPPVPHRGHGPYRLGWHHRRSGRDGHQLPHQPGAAQPALRGASLGGCRRGARGHECRTLLRHLSRGAGLQARSRRRPALRVEFPRLVILSPRQRAKDLAFGFRRQK
jgi:putative ABC transport system permease protein